MTKSQFYYTRSYKLSLKVNVTSQSYSPRGFLFDPKYINNFVNFTEEDCAEYLEGFIKYLAQTLQFMIKDSIKSQYYKNRWTPLTQKYLDFKKSHGLSQNIWEATGKLYKSITYEQLSSTTYIVGIGPTATYDNGVPVSLVAECMEFGTSKMPARPLFRPATRFLQSHIRIYWELYMLDSSKFISQKLVNKIKNLKKTGNWILP